MSHPHIVEVAAAVITRADGSFLLARRPEGKPYAGYWEFPGGKVNSGESLRHALERELLEELAIHAQHAYPWITRTFTYSHATVRLCFYRVVEWRASPGHAKNRSCHGNPRTMSMSNRCCRQMRRYCEPFVPAGLCNYQRRRMGNGNYPNPDRHALQDGVRLIQVREKAMAKKDVACFCR